MNIKKDLLLMLITTVFQQNEESLASVILALGNSPIAAITIVTVVAIWAIRDIFLAP